jgi:hypothetical protein
VNGRYKKCSETRPVSYQRTFLSGANTAVQFFPSAVFGGKLLGYLGQFMSMGAIERAVINLGATLFAAMLANMMPDRMSRPFTDFGKIVRETLGFGLGIAWNIFLGSLFGPTEQNAAHLFGLMGYLGIVTLIAFRVAAEAAYVDTVVEPNTIDRMWGLLSFAMNVACAFTLVALVNALLPAGWMGDVESFFVLLIFSAVMSALVGRVDLSRAREEASGEVQNNWGADHLPCILRMLIFVPCVWCCCPWLPVLFILSGTSTIGVKEKWFQLVAMISGLSASIEASGMLTNLTGLIAGALHICDEKHCPSPWMFVLVQVGIAVVTTIILVPLLVLFVPPFLWSPAEDGAYVSVDSIEYVPEDSISLLTPIPPPSNSRSKYESV